MLDPRNKTLHKCINVEELLSVFHFDIFINSIKNIGEGNT